MSTVKFLLRFLLGAFAVGPLLGIAWIGLFVGWMFTSLSRWSSWGVLAIDGWVFQRKESTRG